MLEQVEKAANLVLANLLWCIFVVPLVTIPAATAGLFAVASQSIRGQHPLLILDFLRAMRQLWRKATAIALLDALAGGFLGLNLTIFSRMRTLDAIAFLSRSVTLFALLFVLLINLYVWSLMVVYDMTLRQLIEISYKLVLVRPVRSFGVLAAAIVPVLVSLLLPRAVFIFLTAACCAWIVTWGTWPVIQQHVQGSEFEPI